RGPTEVARTAQVRRGGREKCPAFRWIAPPHGGVRRSDGVRRKPTQGQVVSARKWQSHDAIAGEAFAGAVGQGAGGLESFDDVLRVHTRSLLAPTGAAHGTSVLFQAIRLCSSANSVASTRVRTSSLV